MPDRFATVDELDECVAEFTATTSRISLRALALFRLANLLWAIADCVYRVGFVLHDKPGDVVNGFGNLANDLGARLGAMVERKEAARDA